MLAALLAACSTPVGLRNGAEAVAWPRVTSAIAPDPALEARVERLLAGMTLEQKVGQMTQAEIRTATPQEAAWYFLGSVLNGGGSRPGGDKYASAARWLELAEAYHAASLATPTAVQVPIVWGTDAVHGHNNVFGATLFPHNIGLGATRDAALVAEIGRATARAVRASGIAWTFAPTLAVARDDRWGRTYESYAEDPALVAQLGGAMVRGLQQGLGGRDGESGVLATAKHYLGDGGTDDGRDQGLNRATETQLLALHAPGYFSALAAGAQTVMVSLHAWQNDPGGPGGPDHGRLHGSHYLLTEVLKNRLGFDGFVVSDWNGIGQVAGCTVSHCAAAINAGIDMVMVPDDWKAFIANTLADVRSGAIPMARIDDAVRRILRVKLRAGLFERRPAQAPQAGQTQALQARDLARRAVRESLVLLKNQRRLLPLPRSSRVLVVGRGADSLELQTGGWSLSWQGTGNVNADFPAGDTLLAGLRRALGPERVQYSATGEGVDPRGFDAVIAVLAEKPYAEFSGDIAPSGTLHHASRYPEDLRLLQRVAGHGVPVVSVLYSGRPVFANDLINRSDAFVAAWLPGTEGAAIADVLLRRADGGVEHEFTGRLPFSWPRGACQTPLNAGDKNYDPLFALGHGLASSSPGEVPRLDETLPRGGCGSGPELLLFNQAAQPPFTLNAGLLAEPRRDEALALDPTQRLAWPPAPATPALRLSSVQLHTQHDALHVQWRAPARVVLEAERELMLSAFAEGALVFDLRIDRAPTAPVRLAMECGRPCGAAFDLAPRLAALPPGGTHTLKLPLACLAAAGADLARVNMPFIVAADAPFAAAFTRVRIVAGAARDRDALRCADLRAAPLP